MLLLTPTAPSFPACTLKVAPLHPFRYPTHLGCLSYCNGLLQVPSDMLVLLPSLFSHTSFSTISSTGYMGVEIWDFHIGSFLYLEYPPLFMCLTKPLVILQNPVPLPPGSFWQNNLFLSLSSQSILCIPVSWGLYQCVTDALTTYTSAPFTWISGRTLQEFEVMVFTD